ncbi:MAG TPA: recombinase family protein [Solirubrobacteraceae bacterium]|nr:recombinase family protein [Solirubrobacteraceae bacterium]
MIYAGIYARISSDRDGDGLAVGRQLVDCEAKAAENGWAVADRYVDSDISAYSGKDRPEYRRLIADIDAGLVNGVIVYNLDRLHRQPRELEEFIDVCRRARIEGNLASCQGYVDLATHHGVLTARLLGAVSAMESDDKSRRIQRKHEEIAQAGRPSGGGSRPYGFEPGGLTIRESEAVVVRECARRALAGESLRSITTSLNERGVPSSTGGSWAPQTLRRMLISARIGGMREHNGEIVAEAAWPAIISPSESAQLRATLTDENRRTNRSARRYLLTRLLRCGHCGQTLVSRPTADGTRCYVCAKGPGSGGCGRLSVRADPLEEFVVHAVLYRLDSPEMARALNGSAEDHDAERVRLEVEEARAQLAELAHDWGERIITRQEWLAARQPIEDRLQFAQKRLAKLSQTSAIGDYVGNGDALRERWEELPLTGQQAVVAAVVDHLVVKPGRRGYNRFDPSRFEPVWRA